MCIITSKLKEEFLLNKEDNTAEKQKGNGPKPPAMLPSKVVFMEN